MIHCNAVVKFSSEQKPHFDNKIILSKNKVDDFGVPQAEIHWNVKEDVFDSLKIVLEELGKQFIINDIGRIGIDRIVYDKTLKNLPDIFANHHHMGGTRMSINESLGGVDRNLKVHGTDNFYIVGSSVFPSSSHWNPTFTITQLSLRLSDFLT